MFLSHKFHTDSVKNALYIHTYFYPRLPPLILISKWLKRFYMTSGSCKNSNEWSSAALVFYHCVVNAASEAVHYCEGVVSPQCTCTKGALTPRSQWHGGRRYIYDFVKILLVQGSFYYLILWCFFFFQVKFDSNFFFL